MTTFFLTSLFVLGTLFGSFASVLIWRIRSGEGGIATGRSHCPKCNHTLGVLDLFPIFSYIFLRGKCRFCQEKISPIYPLLELASGLLFVLSAFFLIDQNLIFTGSETEIMRLFLILSAAFVTIVFVFYDLRFMEIPDEVLLPFIAILLLLLASDTWYSTHFFSHFQVFSSTPLSPILDWLLWSFIIYSFFYLQILIPGTRYAIKEKKLSIIPQLFFEYFAILPYVFFRLFVRKKISDEEPQSREWEIPSWIGHGDLRIAVFMGLLAGTKIALLWLLLAYFCGSIIGVAILLYTRNRNTVVPFGPYLALGLYISLFWYTPIIEWYTRLFTL